MHFSEKFHAPIYFETNFPYKITSWEETYPDGFGENVQMLTTTLDKNIMNNYWNKNPRFFSLQGSVKSGIRNMKKRIIFLLIFISIDLSALRNKQQ